MGFGVAPLIGATVDAAARLGLRAGPELLSDSLASGSALLDSASRRLDPTTSGSSRSTSPPSAHRSTPFSITGNSFGTGITIPPSSPACRKETGLIRDGRYQMTLAALKPVQHNSRRWHRANVSAQGRGRSISSPSARACSYASFCSYSGARKASGPGFCGSLYHISFGRFLLEFELFAVQLSECNSHAFPVLYKESSNRIPTFKNTHFVWICAAISAISTRQIWRIATPLYSREPVVVNSCLIPLSR